MTRVSTAFVILAALFWGPAGGTGGILIEDGWDPLAVSLYRGAIGLLFVLVRLAVRPRRSINCSNGEAGNCIAVRRRSSA